MPASAIGCKRHVPDPSPWDCLDLSTDIKDYQNTSTNLSKKTYPYQNPIKKPLISTFPIKGKGKLGLRRVGNGKKTPTDCEKENSEKRWGKGDFPEFGMNAIQEHAALENC